MTPRTAIALSLVLSAPALAADLAPRVDVHQGAAITVTVQQTLKSAPAKVWGVVTSPAGLTALTGIAPDKGAKAAPLAKVGDGFAARLPEWNDPGRLVVTSLEPNKWMHLTWEPDSGKYMGQVRIVLQAEGAGTTLTYSDRYTDDKPKAAEEAKRIGEDAAKAVAAFRALVDK